MKLKTITQKNVDGMLWDETSWLLDEANPHKKQQHGSEKWCNNWRLHNQSGSKPIWYFHLWRYDQKQITLHSPKEPQKNKILFSKSQFKILCSQG